jgi:hypothetical protein
MGFPHIMHGISMVVRKRVQVGVGRGICIVSSSLNEGRNATDGSTDSSQMHEVDRSQELLLRDFLEIGSKGDILVLDRSSGPGMTVRYLFPRLS